MLSFVTSSLQCIYVTEMLKELEEKRLGIKVEGTWLLYAGDIVLLVRDQVELQVILDVLGKSTMKWRF